MTKMKTKITGADRPFGGMRLLPLLVCCASWPLACSSDPEVSGADGPKTALDGAARDATRRDGAAQDLLPVHDWPGAADGACSAEAAKAVLDVPYAAHPGVSPTLSSLDIYVPARADRCKPAPTVVWVHGGGWFTGDKSGTIADKISLFNGAGYVLVSVNYRLSPQPPSSDPLRVMFPTHAEDVALALRWIEQNIAKYGGDPGKIALLGHSAGAHLVALISTDERFLAAPGSGLGLLRCAGSFDTEGYDIVKALDTASAKQRAILETAFGSSSSTQALASPITHVVAGKGIPPFLLVSRGQAERKAIVAAFATALHDAGVKATVIDASALSHAEVNENIGKAGDLVMTAPVISFLKGCFGS